MDEEFSDSGGSQTGRRIRANSTNKRDGNLGKLSYDVNDVSDFKTIGPRGKHKRNRTSDNGINFRRGKAGSSPNSNDEGEGAGRRRKGRGGGKKGKGSRRNRKSRAYGDEYDSYDDESDYDEEDEYDSEDDNIDDKVNKLGKSPGTSPTKGGRRRKRNRRSNNTYGDESLESGDEDSYYDGDS